MRALNPAHDGEVLSLDPSHLVAARFDVQRGRPILAGFQRPINGARRVVRRAVHDAHHTLDKVPVIALDIRLPLSLELLALLILAQVDHVRAAWRRRARDRADRPELLAMEPHRTRLVLDSREVMLTEQLSGDREVHRGPARHRGDAARGASRRPRHRIRHGHPKDRRRSVAAQSTQCGRPQGMNMNRGWLYKKRPTTTSSIIVTMIASFSPKGCDSLFS